MSWSPADGQAPAVTTAQLIAAIAAFILLVTAVVVAGWVGWVLLR